MYDGAPIVHHHFDLDGNLVGRTEIQSPWTDEARQEAEALHEAELMFCRDCGGLREDCSDPARPFYPQRHICYASRQQAAADRRYAEKHKNQPFHDGAEKRWSDKVSAGTPFHFRDGVRVWVSPYDLSPEDTFID